MQMPKYAFRLKLVNMSEVSCSKGAEAKPDAFLLQFLSQNKFLSFLKPTSSMKKDAMLCRVKKIMSHVSSSPSHQVNCNIITYGIPSLLFYPSNSLLSC